MAYKSQTVSAVLITLNNGATLERTLKSITWVDDIIVMDKGSTDSTLEIARRFTQHVFFHPSENLTMVWRDVLSQAKTDWILWLEPTEWVEEMLRHEIDGLLLNTPSQMNGYTIPRHLKYHSDWLDSPVGEEPARALRLVRKNQWEIRHDWIPHLRINGLVGHLDRPLGYAPYHTIEDLFTAMNSQSTLAAYDYLDENGGKNVPGFWIILWRMKWGFCKQFWLQHGYRKGPVKLYFIVADMVYQFLMNSKVRELSTTR